MVLLTRFTYRVSRQNLPLVTGNICRWFCTFFAVGRICRRQYLPLVFHLELQDISSAGKLAVAGDLLPNNQARPFQFLNVSTDRTLRHFAVISQGFLGRKTAIIGVVSVSQIQQHHLRRGLQPALLESPVGCYMAHTMPARTFCAQSKASSSERRTFAYPGHSSRNFTWGPVRSAIGPFLTSTRYVLPP
jgi:hypothetical protein